MHQSHKAVKANDLLAAHRDSACRWIENRFFFKIVRFFFRIILQLFDNATLRPSHAKCIYLFCRWWLRLAASCSIRRVGAFLVFWESRRNMWNSGCWILGGWTENSPQLYSWSWSMSASPVMTILFSILVSDTPPFTVFVICVVVVVLVVSEVMVWALSNTPGSASPLVSTSAAS